MKSAVLIAGIAAVVIVSGVALWDYHEEPEFCADLCHVMDPYLASWNGSDFQVQAHAEADLTCLDCHEPTIGEQVQEAAKFVTGQYQDPLEARKFPDEFCLRCHEHGSYDELAERTKDYAVEGEKLNPHDAHPSVDGADAERIECWHCHKMHRRSRGIEYCYVCHHERTFQNCGECH